MQNQHQCFFAFGQANSGFPELAGIALHAAHEAEPAPHHPGAGRLDSCLQVYPNERQCQHLQHHLKERSLQIRITEQ